MSEVAPSPRVDRLVAVARAVQFVRGPDAERPYRATVDSVEWLVRINDFPSEPLYTLLVGGVATFDLDEWPGAWLRPA